MFLDVLNRRIEIAEENQISEHEYRSTAIHNLKKRKEKKKDKQNFRDL